MIHWKNHLAGFTGAHKYLSRAFRLLQRISVTTVAAVIPTDEVFPLFYKVLINNDSIMLSTLITNQSFASTIMTSNMNAQVSMGGDYFTAVRL